MTTRRNLLMMMAATAAAGVAGTAAGCREPAGKGGAVGVPDVLVAKTKDGLAVVRGSELVRLGAGAASLSGSSVCVAAKGELSFISTRSGLNMGKYALTGDWAPRTLSSAGSLAALMAPGGDPVHPAARPKTTIVLARVDGDIRHYDLPGVVEPDAFTTDQQALFVLEWLPASAPDHYRVRRMNLMTGALVPLFTRDKIPVPVGAEEEMRGAGRLGVSSPDRKMLYTLYTHQPDHQHTRDLIAGRRANVHAFVHSLNLEQAWAYCIDLPAPFGEADASQYTMTLSSDGVWLYVADLGAGKLARASTESLEINRVTDIDKLAGEAYAAASRDQIFLAAGDQIQVLARDGSRVARWKTKSPIHGLTVTTDLARLYIGHDGGVSWRDLQGNGSGALLEPEAHSAVLPGLLSVVRAV
jgi:hypothetical protein